MIGKIFSTYNVFAFVAITLAPVFTGLAFILFPWDFLGLYIAVALLALGWLWGRKVPLPKRFFARYFPLLLPAFLLFLGFTLLAAFGGESFRNFWAQVLAVVIGASQACFLLGALLAAEFRARSARRLRGVVGLLGLGLVCGVLGVLVHMEEDRRTIPPDVASADSLPDHGVPTWKYEPFAKDNRLVSPSALPSLTISSDYPRLDGAVAVFPVYAAVAQAVYAKMDERTARDYVSCTNTVQAYKRLTEGEADIFFGARPSAEQRAAMERAGLTVAETAIGKEAFVFFTHRDNPVRSLTREQIRGIYGGEIRNWKELGGPDESILAFQRPAGSGSQTTLLNIMGKQAVMRPLKEEGAAGMAGIVMKVAAYRNRMNAIGYSFRWYVTTLAPNPNIRLLAVDAVEPTPENIANGSYPFTVPLLAVTCRPLSGRSKDLLDWITGQEGQNLLEKIGYVGLRDSNPPPVLQ